MQTRFFPASVASRFCLMGIVAALLMFSLLATPVFAQAVAIDEGDDVQYNGVCQNIIGAIGDITQNQTGTSTAVDVDEEVGPVGTVAGEAAEGSDAEADARAETDAVVEEDEVVEEVDAVEEVEAVADRGVVAEVAQEQGVSIEQVNECLNGAVGTDDTGTDDTGTDDTDTDDVATDDKDVVLTETIPDQKVLANTGGPALLLPALGLLLISSVALRNLLRR